MNNYGYIFSKFIDCVSISKYIYSIFDYNFDKVFYSSIKKCEHISLYISDQRMSSGKFFICHIVDLDIAWYNAKFYKKIKIWYWYKNIYNKLECISDRLYIGSLDIAKFTPCWGEKKF